VEEYKMNKVNILIDGRQASVPDNYTIYQAASSIGVKIPTLCYLKDLNEVGACRICVVEVKGARGLVASCVHPVAEGMEITTTSPTIIDARRGILELLISNHKVECLTCEKVGICKLQEYCYEYDVTTSPYGSSPPAFPYDDSNPFYDFDPAKCIMCRRCVAEAITLVLV
jgi:NADH dehydrogenase/NADH:ubiquinone oxidoreductase subunit G